MRLVRNVCIGAVVVFFASAATIYAQNDKHQGQDRQKPPQAERGNQGKPGGAERQQAKPPEGRGAGQQARPQGGDKENRGQPAERGQYERGQPGQRPQERQPGKPQVESKPQFEQQPQFAPKPYPGQMRSQQQVRVWQDERGWNQHLGAWKEQPTWRRHQAVNWARDHRTWVQRGGYGGYFIPERQFHLYFGPYHAFRVPRPIIVQGYPRFFYRGYWFMLVDPWPEYWSPTWYTTDDVFLDYDDGYYLYNPRYPGVAIAVAVVF